MGPEVIKLISMLNSGVPLINIILPTIYFFFVLSYKAEYVIQTAGHRVLIFTSRTNFMLS